MRWSRLVSGLVTLVVSDQVEVVGAMQHSTFGGGDGILVAGHQCAAFEPNGGADRVGLCDNQIPSRTTTANMFHSRKVAKVFVAQAQGDGDGVTVYHSIRQLDPFLMLDEAILALPAGFPEHPHRGFETVSYVLPSCKGKTYHEDFLGNKGELRPGDLQWMSAGRGIMHAEMPATREPAHALQLWVNLPKARKMMEPRYQEIKREATPHVFDDEKKVEAIVFAGEVFGQKGPIETEAPVTYIHFIMQKDSKLEYKLPEGHNAFIYTLTGSGFVSGENMVPHQTTILEREGDGVEVVSKEGTEFLVLSGRPLNEPIAQHGPFVMNTEDEIRQAFFDFRSGKNGFENAPGWAPKISQQRFQH